MAKDMRDYWVAIVFAVIISSITLYVLLHRQINLDVAWFVYSAGQVLDGSQWGVDIKDINTPFAVWIYLPFVVLARVINIESILFFKVALTALICLEIVVLYQLFSRILNKEDGWVKWVVFILLSGGISLGPGYTFGQREHIIVLLFLPYLLVSVEYVNNRSIALPARILSTILAGLGLLIKPYYVLLAILLELYIAYRTKNTVDGHRRKIEILTLVSILMGGLIVLWLFYPAYISTLNELLKYYLIYDQVPIAKLLFPWIWVIIPLVGLHYYLYNGKFKTLRDFIALGLVGSYSFYLMQQKGWEYQSYFARIMLMLLISLIVLELYFFKGYVERWVKKNAILGKAVLTVAIIVWGFFYLNISYSEAWIFGTSKKHEWFEELKSYLMDRKSSIKSMYLVSTNVYPSFPLVNETQLKWAGSLNCLCYLDYSMTSAGRRYYLPQKILDIVSKDLEMNKPDIIIFDQSHFKQGIDEQVYDFYPEMEKEPSGRFREMMDKYYFDRSVYSLDGLIGYDLYLRK
jgi:hypothetical protein